MAKQRLTPWFPANVKPVRAGSYEVGYPHGGRIVPYPLAYHYFDGIDWINDASSAPKILKGRHGSIESYEAAYWRGLAEQPK